MKGEKYMLNAILAMIIVTIIGFIIIKIISQKKYIYFYNKNKYINIHINIQNKPKTKIFISFIFHIQQQFCYYITLKISIHFTNSPNLKINDKNNNNR